MSTPSVGRSRAVLVSPVSCARDTVRPVPRSGYLQWRKRVVVGIPNGKTVSCKSAFIRRQIKTGSVAPTRNPAIMAAGESF